MANERNLKRLSSSEAREYGKKGGKARAQKIAARKTLREQLLMMLNEGKTQDNLCLALLEKAKSGDTKAFEVIRDTIGEKPENVLKADMTLTQALVVWDKTEEEIKLN